jgi:hypothetical protein
VRPIQVWLPTINSSWADPVFELDVQHAFQEWSGAQTVWFVPTIEKPYRWKEGQNPWDWILAVPATGRGERVDVSHVEEARTKARRRILSVQEFGTEAWQEQLRKRVDVARAWGPIGLFYALLVEHLEQGLRLSECEHCHRLNSGKKGKRFCGPDDDPACYAQRRARDKRKERAL